jgi:hypothetical protein
MLIASVSPRTGGKTTGTGWLAHALLEAERDYELEVYDADHSKQLWKWARDGGFSFPVTHKPTARFHREVTVPDDRIVLVDCGHSENHPDITDSVLRIADLAILHMAPTQADFDRIVDPEEGTPFKDVIARTATYRPTKDKPDTWVLLNRCVPNAASTKHFREEMEAEGFNVFTTVINRSETIAQSVTFPVIGAARSPFGALVTEMQERGLLR